MQVGGGQGEEGTRGGIVEREKEKHGLDSSCRNFSGSLANEISFEIPTDQLEFRKFESPFSTIASSFKFSQYHKKFISICYFISSQRYFIVFIKIFLRVSIVFIKSLFKISVRQKIWTAKIIHRLKVYWALQY